MFVIFALFNFLTPQNYKHCLKLPKLFAIFFQENVRFFLTKSVNYQQLIETQTIMEKEDFTLKLKFFFKKRGIKQNDLAKQLGVSHPVVSNVVNGRDRLGTQSAVKWGEILGIDPLWLMTQGEQGTAPDETSPPPPTAPDDAILSVYRLRGRCGCAGLWRFHVTSLPIRVTYINKTIAIVARLAGAGAILCA